MTAEMKQMESKKHLALTNIIYTIKKEGSLRTKRKLLLIESKSVVVRFELRGELGKRVKEHRVSSLENGLLQG